MHVFAAYVSYVGVCTSDCMYQTIDWRRQDLPDETLSSPGGCPGVSRGGVLSPRLMA